MPQNLLLQRMEDLGMPQVWTDLLHRLYKDNTVVTKFCGITTEPVAVKRGLKQGCPLSPLLYMLYASGLEQCILECSKGFTLNHQLEGLPITWTLPGLVFADDFVLVAERHEDLPHLVTQAASHLAGLGLMFNAKNQRSYSSQAQNPIDRWCFLVVH